MDKEKHTAEGTWGQKSGGSSRTLRDEPEEEEQLTETDEEIKRQVAQQAQASQAATRKAMYKRGHSKGSWGTPPDRPIRICIEKGHIKDSDAKRTFKQILRVHWPRGAFTYTDIVNKDPNFVTEVIKEFKASYIYIWLLQAVQESRLGDGLQ
ncbi:hypothetical protein POM88_004619 [Heracleum sosnowskyi]|uniref:Uncharacterized protein n=1 Tax=Heracleum sosnowskyi TaxID=360622 RepID=A0AAD8JK95_9APIA|nr:hypothetical protein POM88_004619 [Heracleum sosnowskyi]